MKRLILLSSFAMLVTPFVASARDHDRDRHRKTGADQMASAGLAAAAVIGIAGYLVLRKRSVVQN